MILDIINKKRLGKELSFEELDLIFNKYLKGDVENYQMSSLLMAICINGMSDKEVFDLTKIFIDSGKVLDFTDIEGIKVDKHSTGGIGDKTTMVIAPIVASLGVPIIKMSGRGLGYTGGTVDKLESIPGYRIDLDDEEIRKQVKEIGIVMTGQTNTLVPMDKAIYNLRDVSATVSSIPLIASSIMSKKIASGADKILIDIKIGNGALIQDEKDALKLSELMIKIGKVYNKEVRTIISDMNTPLGNNIGNSLEVLESINILQGKEKDNNLTKLCIELATEMVSMGKEISKEEAQKQVVEVINNKKAYEKFLEVIKYQKGNLDKMKISDKIIEIKSTKKGIINSINALELGKLSQHLGAGKEKITDKIDYSVGIELKKHVGDSVDCGTVLAYLYVNEKYPQIDVDKIFDVL